MLTCEICGIQKENRLDSHIESTHKISCKEYKKLYPDAEYHSDLIKEKQKLKRNKYLNKDIKELECQICNFKNKITLISHIKFVHKMSGNEYKEKYPNFKIYEHPDESKNLISQAKIDINSINQKKLDRIKECNEIAKENGEILICQICNLENYFSLVSHIERTHKISCEEYKIKYPNCKIQIVTDEQKDLFINNVVNNNEIRHTNQELVGVPSQIKFWTRQGLTEQEAQEKVLENQKNASAHQVDTEEKRQKLSDRYSGDKNPMSLESTAKRYNISIEEAHQYMPALNRVGEKHPMFGKHHSDETKHKIASNMPKTYYNVSKGEKELFELIKEFVNFEKNIAVFGYNCDFVCENFKIIIEYFGDFWHANPKIFHKDWFNKRSKRIAHEIWKRDEIKLNSLEKLGYKIIVVWENDFKKNKQEVIERIQNAINSKKNSQ